MRFLRLAHVAVMALSVTTTLFAAVELHAASTFPNPVIVGNARFTVVTPNLIRMEYEPDGKFVDSETLFAINRTAHDAGFQLTQTPTQTIIKTSSMDVVYTPDGKPFSASNLTAHIDATKSSWTPGQADPLNLGGTARTLDGWSGPGDLGKGVLSRSGWAVIDDSQSPLLTDAGWVQSRPDAQKSGQDWYFFGYGTDYRAALKSLTTISGSVPLPRRYAMGVWYSRYWPWSEADYKQIVTEYSDHNFPLDNVVLDMDWHEDGWTGWSWNRKLLPDPVSLLSWFHDQGLHDTLNLHPADGVAPHEDQYAAFMKAMGQDPASGKTLPFDAASKPYMDALFSTVMDPLKDAGVDFWWLDWQQYPFTKSVPDLTNLFWLNTLLYDYTAKDGQRGLSFSRWAGYGDQRHPIAFSGDANTGFPMLAFEVPFTATAGNVGCFFWTHDIGGHMGGRNEESYTRWCQFGATSPVLRSHSTRDVATDRRPWNYPTWAEDSMRISFHLRSELFPYIYSSAAESCQDSVPLDRPVYFDLPTADAAYHNGQEYMLGDNILVAPIVMAGVGPGRVGYQSVWFPTGSTWYNLFTGERSVGGSDSLIAADINEFPIYARGGVPVPMQPYTARMGTTQVTTLRIRAYPGADNKTGTSSLYEDDGLTTSYQKGAFATTELLYSRKGTSVTVRVSPAEGRFTGQPAARNYVIELPDTTSPIEVTVNGQEAPFTYDAVHYTTKVTTDQFPITQAVSVTLEGIKPSGWAALHTAAVWRRTNEVVPMAPLAPIPGVPTPLASIRLAKTVEEQAAVMAVSGIGLTMKNVTPDFYPVNIQPTFYAPKSLIDSDSVTFSDGKSASITSGPVAFNPGPGRRPSVTFSIGGKSYHLPNGALYSDDNIAPLATATASSVQSGTQSFASAAIDSVVDGYPAAADHEWASNGELTGAWLQLNWKSPQTIDRIWLYDRPNTDDQVTSATITYSDGSSTTVGTLPNDGKTPLEVTFPSKTVSWLKITVTGTSKSTQNVGLSEVAVFKAGAKVML
jgi:alpha-glucosidase (family GH31 glycosyl hydrolase)